MMQTSSRWHRTEESGEEALRDEIVEKYLAMRPALLNYVRHLLRNMAEAEDVVQVAFMKLFAARSNAVEIDNMRAWLYRVVHNLAIDQLRKQTQQEQFSKLWPFGAAPYRGGPDAEKTLIEQQTIADILSRLNAREKYCLLLRAEGLTYDEIASVVEISSKAVSVYLVRALKKARGER